MKPKTVNEVEQLSGDSETVSFAKAIKLPKVSAPSLLAALYTVS